MNPFGQVFHVIDLSSLLLREPNESKAAMLTFATGAPDGSTMTARGNFVSLEGKSLIFESEESIPNLACVSVEHNDALFLGEVSNCEAIGPHSFRSEISVDQILTGLQSLAALRKKTGLLPSEVDPSTTRHKRARESSRARSQTLSNSELEGIAESPAVEVLMAAAAAFQDLATGKSWLATPSPGLGGKAPISLIATREGRQAVLNELGLIEHGMF